MGKSRLVLEFRKALELNRCMYHAGSGLATLDIARVLLKRRRSGDGMGCCGSGHSGHSGCWGGRVCRHPGKIRTQVLLGAWAKQAAPGRP